MMWRFQNKDLNTKFLNLLQWTSIWQDFYLEKLKLTMVKIQTIWTKFNRKWENFMMEMNLKLSFSSSLGNQTKQLKNLIRKFRLIKSRKSSDLQFRMNVFAFIATKQFRSLVYLNAAVWEFVKDVSWYLGKLMNEELVRSPNALTAKH